MISSYVRISRDKKLYPWINNSHAFKDMRGKLQKLASKVLVLLKFIPQVSCFRLLASALNSLDTSVTMALSLELVGTRVNNKEYKFHSRIQAVKEKFRSLMINY